MILQATVANVGQEGTDGFTVRFTVDGDPIGTDTVKELAPGANATVRSPTWSASSGQHRIGVHVDPAETVPGGDPAMENRSETLRIASEEPSQTVPALGAWLSAPLIVGAALLARRR